MLASAGRCGVPSASNGFSVSAPSPGADSGGSAKPIGGWARKFRDKAGAAATRIGEGLFAVGAQAKIEDEGGAE